MEDYITGEIKIGDKFQGEIDGVIVQVIDVRHYQNNSYYILKNITRTKGQAQFVECEVRHFRKLLFNKI